MKRTIERTKKEHSERPDFMEPLPQLPIRPPTPHNVESVPEKNEVVSKLPNVLKKV